MSRLPTPGGDDGTWGDILNDFLKIEHNTDGSQKTLPVSKGGTGATDAATALTNLGSASSTDLAAKATDSTVVHNTGNETIAGTKIFSSAPAVPAGSFPESAVTNLTSDLAAKATPAQAQAALSMSAIIKSGTATVANNVMPPGIRIGYASTLNAIYVRVGTAPTTSALTVSVNRNGSSIATVSVAPTTTSGSSTGLTISLAASDILTFDITAIGSGTAGADVAVDLVGS